MNILSPFSALARKFGLRQKQPAPVPVSITAPIPEFAPDPTPDMVILKIINLLQNDNFSFSSGHIAECAFYASAAGKREPVSGVDFIKSKDTGNLSVIGLVCKSDGKKKDGPFSSIDFNDISRHYVVQLDVHPDQLANISTLKTVPLKSVPLKDIAAQLDDPHFNIVTFFETIPYVPSRKPPTQEQKITAG